MGTSRKNMALVRRQAHRDRPAGLQPSRTNDDSSSSSSGGNKTDDFSIQLPGGGGKLYVDQAEMDRAWIPAPSAVLKLMISLRLAAALWSTIADCDEVFNYWEPLHLLTYGEGFQTWEYSPLYAIRSYFYVYLHSMPAYFLAQLFPYSKVAVFVCMRCLLGIFCMAAEYDLYTAVCARLSQSIGRFFLLFTVLSTGMFISCTAFLPSTFAMVMNMFAMAAYLRESWFIAIMCTAGSALVGWPFAALLGLPIAIDMMIIKPRPSASRFCYFAAVAAIVVGGSLVSVDSYYYGKRVFAPLNIVLYNVFSGHGPDLYGVEPLSFYLKNLLLNWNFVALLAPLGLPLAVIAYIAERSDEKSTEKNFMGIPTSSGFWRPFCPLLLISLSLFAWCLVFFTQPHKEERFLFPIYPLLAILAAVGLDAAQKLCRRVWPSLSSLAWLLVLAFITVSISRTYALHRNFGAHIEVYKSLNEHLVHNQAQLDFGPGLETDRLRVCVGKEWYRFPSSFFLPEVVADRNGQKRGVSLHFLKSEFAGLLPKYYESGKIPEITRLIPTEMNDANEEEMSRYVPIESCDFVIDVEVPDDMTTPLEPNFGQLPGLKRLASHQFLIAPKSHWFFRAFYFPILSAQNNVFGAYSLYQSTSGGGR